MADFAALSQQSENLRYVVNRARARIDGYAAEGRSNIYFQSSVQSLIQGYRMLKHPPSSMILEVLREFRLAPKDRKALEVASQFFLKTRVGVPSETEAAKRKAY